MSSKVVEQLRLGPRAAVSIEYHTDFWPLLLSDTYRARLSPMGLSGTGGEGEERRKGHFGKQKKEPFL